MPTTSPHGAPLAFLHSSAVHIESFNRLGDELAPGLAHAHVVREDLLCAKEHAGAITPVIEMRLMEQLYALADNGAKVIVVTCAVLGEIVEKGGDALMKDVGVPVLLSARAGFVAALRHATEAIAA